MFGATKIRWLFGLGVASVQGRFCQKVLRIHRNAAKDVCCVSAYQRDWENSSRPLMIKRGWGGGESVLRMAGWTAKGEALNTVARGRNKCYWTGLHTAKSLDREK